MRRELLILVTIFGFAFLGCERQGPVERAGERVDEVVDNVKEGQNPLREKGPMEEAGEAVDEAVNDVRDR